ncbi:MAG TPA: response regulator [Methanoregula sp.]|nr:response regulator [Methanoregula sp.]
MEHASILVVEDELIVAESLKMALTGMGYAVPKTAGSSEEALLDARECAPDLILMDIVLEGSDMDGVETASRIRAAHDIPVIFVTAFADDETLERVKKAEPFAYIMKPFNERELHSAIELALHRHRAGLDEKRRNAILFATSFAVEWFLRYLKDSRRAGENPDHLWNKGIVEILDHIRVAADVRSVTVFRMDPGEEGPGSAGVRYDSAGLGSSGAGVYAGTGADTLRFTTTLWRSLLAAGNAIAGEVRMLPKEERKYFEDRGIASIAALPIVKDNGLWGFISYSDEGSREWSDGEIEALMFAGDIIGAMMD